MAMTTSRHAFDDDYVPNAWPAINVLRRRDKRVDDAVKLLENGRLEEAVRVLADAGFEQDQIAYIAATVLKTSFEDVIDHVYDVLENISTRDQNSTSMSGGRLTRIEKEIDKVKTEISVLARRLSDIQDLLLEIKSEIDVLKKKLDNT